MLDFQSNRWFLVGQNGKAKSSVLDSALSGNCLILAQYLPEVWQLCWLCDRKKRWISLRDRMEWRSRTQMKYKKAINRLQIKATGLVYICRWVDDTKGETTIWNLWLDVQPYFQIVFIMASWSSNLFFWLYVFHNVAPPWKVFGL